ncbi:Sec-independent protein translocase protein TatB [Temperatibacter marinus]|uniref:Sec-independent protein translocase protein TatB n=1 Tax=Temperatibacter marinus TaxID=1456591 RepID=A0AA52EHX2_9PROT|nr:Sec-independent protein translocase protein TatB [Temperatibacter marinus]WND02624.1 Sec-independent protein translocase protein TatB [Temperatibacter marinus]
MFDIGTIEMVILAIVALLVVGPKDLPKLMRSVSQFIGKIRGLAGEFKSTMNELADEVDRETDPFREERDAEGITPNMSPEDITAHIMGNKETADEAADQFAAGESQPDLSSEIDETVSKEDTKGSGND